MRNILSYILIISTLLVAGGCSKLKNVVSSEAPFSESLQREYFEGTQHLLKGDKEAAYNSFLRCSEEEPEVASFHYDLGKIDYELGRMESALLQLDLAVNLDGENDWYRYYRGRTLVAIGKFDEASKDFEVWISKRPGDLEALRECTDIFLKEGEGWNAYNLLVFYEEEIALNVDVRLDRLSLISISDFKFNAFEDFIDQAIKDFPEEPMFLYHKGALAAFVKDYDRAIPIFEKLRLEHPYFMDAALDLESCYSAVGREEDAYNLKLVIFKSDNVRVVDKLSILKDFFITGHLQKDKQEEFVNLLEISIEEHPQDPDLLHYASLYWYNQRDYERSRDALKIVVREKPTSIDAVIDYLGVIYDLKDWEGLIEEGEKASLIFPLEPIIFLYIGDGYHSLKLYSKAISSYKNGLAVTLDSPKISAALQNALAFSYRDGGMKEKSYSAFELSLAFEASPYVMNNHAFFLATDNHNLQNALKWSTLANEMIPDEPNFMDTQALILHLLVRNSDALEWIVAAQTMLSSPDAVFLEREGDIRYSLGEYARANELWESAILAGGGKKRLNEKLNRQNSGNE
ncbi:MAG: hypothetical protein COA49_03515 [Bacteroidetes bacterium]|nr:MAG: hypothetical protein COA49_03515 [Bacteroidota bacterium]